MKVTEAKAYRAMSVAEAAWCWWVIDNVILDDGVKAAVWKGKMLHGGAPQAWKTPPVIEFWARFLDAMNREDES